MEMVRTLSWTVTCVLIGYCIGYVFRSFSDDLTSLMKAKPRVAVSVEGMSPRDLFASIYMARGDGNPDSAYKFADQVMEARKAKH